MIREPITHDWIKEHAGTVLMCHVAMQDCHQMSRKVVDRRTGAPIGLVFCDTSWKRRRRNGARAGTVDRVWFVEGHEAEIATLDEALEILRIQQLAEREIAA